MIEEYNISNLFIEKYSKIVSSWNKEKLNSEFIKVEKEKKQFWKEKLYVLAKRRKELN